ncbi:sialidase family protein [Planctomycetota bacterium]
MHTNVQTFMRLFGWALLGLLAITGPATVVFGQGPAEDASWGSVDTAANAAGTAKDSSPYRIADLEVKVLAAKPGRFFGRCALQQLKDGTWFLVYHESGHHFRYEPAKPTPILSGVLHARFSADNGETWSKEDRCLDGTSIRGFPAFPPGAEPDNGDFEPGEPWAYLAPNGDLVVHSLKDNFNTRKWDGTWQMRSCDGGKTWTDLEKIDFAGIEHDETIWAIDDHFIHEGVVYLGAREVPMPEFWKGMRNLLVKSADNGHTWELVSYVTEKKGTTTEQGIEYLGNGTILCVLNSIDRRHTWLTRSYDMGHTWEPLRDIAAQAGIWSRPRIFTAAHLRGESDGWRDSLILGASNQRTRPGSSFPRRNSLWVSPDRGHNWQVLQLDDETEDTGYGDMLYDDKSKRFVAILYHGTNTEAVLKQYKFHLEEVP